MSKGKQSCSCQEYTAVVERLTRLEEQFKYSHQSIEMQHKTEYEKNRKFLEKISSQYKQISNFLAIIKWLFKTKKRIAIVVILRFLLLSIWFMFLDNWNSELFQYGHFQENVTKFLWHLVKIWNQVR